MPTDAEKDGVARGRRARRKVIACEVFHRELCHLAAEAPDTIDLEFVPKGLHDLPSAEMRERLQGRIDAVDASRYEAVALAYGLCNNGLAGVHAGSIPLLLPRAHDCITLFLGNRDRYRRCFERYPGFYFLTSGWLERGECDETLKPLSIPCRMGMDRSYEDLTEAYGEDNAEYLAEVLGLRGSPHYRGFAYIRMGIGPEAAFEAEARRRAAETDWSFERIQGDMGLLRRLINGPWDPGEFLRVLPGQCIEAVYEGEIVRATGETMAGGKAGICATRQ